MQRADERASEPTGAAVKRRGLMAGAAAMVAGIVATRTNQPVAAANPVLLGSDANVATTITTVLNNAATNPNAAALYGYRATSATNALFGSNDGVVGQSDFANAAGVHGIAATGIGVTGSGVTGVQGIGSSVGVFGSGNVDGTIGVAGYTHAFFPPSTIKGGVVGASREAALPGVFGFHGSAGSGVEGQSFTGYGVQGQGGLAPLRLVPSTTVGVPTTGNHLSGELFIDQLGELFYCRTAGTPGIWVRLDVSIPFFTTLPTPERFVDTRTNLGGVQGPVPANTTHTFLMTARNGQSGNPALQIPDRATAIVGNLTVVGAAGIPLGSFLTVWPTGAQPTVSNINYGPAATSGAIANTFVVGLEGHGNVNVFNLSACDYILDVTGYYMTLAPLGAPL